MNKRGLTEQLVQGLQNIQRMRSEIQLLTSTLGGIVSKTSKFQECSYRVRVQDDQYWTVLLYERKVTFSFRSKGSLVFDSNEKPDMALEDVSTVWGSLPDLVKGLYESIERLQPACLPIIWACDEYEKRHGWWRF